MFCGLAKRAEGSFLSAAILLQIQAVSSEHCVKYCKNPLKTDKENVSGIFPPLPEVGCSDRDVIQPGSA